MVQMIGVSEFFTLLLILGGGGLGLPVATPPLPPDPVVERAAPDDCLAFFGWSGTAKADPQSGNATERLVAEPEVQAFLQHVEAVVTSALRQSRTDSAEAAVVADAAPRLVKALLLNPASLYVADVAMRQDGVDVRAGLVVNTGNDAQAIELAIRKLEGLLLRNLPRELKVEELTIEGVRLRKIPSPPQAPEVLWGFKDSLLLVVVGQDEAAPLIKRLSSAASPAGWLETLRRDLPVDRPGMTTYVNVPRILAVAAPALGDAGPEAALVLFMLGVSDVQSITAVQGLDATGTVSKMLVKLNGEPRGVFMAVSNKPLTAADLKPIPRDANVALALRLDLAKLYAEALRTVDRIDPDSRREFTRGLERAEQELGLNLQKDLLEPLGDTWMMYHAAGEGGALLTSLTAVGSVRDGKRLQATIDKLVALADQQLEREGSRRHPKIHQFTFADAEIRYITAPDMPLAPAWCVKGDQVIVALYPQMIKAYLSRAADAPTLAQSPNVAPLVSGDDGPAMLSYADSRGLFRFVYSALQFALPQLSAETAQERVPFESHYWPSLAAIEPHLLPTVSSVRRTKAGILAESHGSIPGGISQSLATAPFMMFVGYTSARRVEVQASEARTAEREAPAPPRQRPSEGRPSEGRPNEGRPGERRPSIRDKVEPETTAPLPRAAPPAEAPAPPKAESF